MKKSEIIRSIYYSCPKILFLRKLLAKKLIRGTKKYLLDSKIVDLCEKDPTLTKNAVKQHTQLYPHYAASCNRAIDKMLSAFPEYYLDSDVEDIRMDILFCMFAYGFDVEEYVFFHLDKQPVHIRKMYLSKAERTCANLAMNEYPDTRIFNDKWESYKRLEKYYQRDAIVISNPIHFKRFSAFVKKHPVFVKKQVNQSCGRSIELVNSYCGEKNIKELFAQIIQEGKCILEEVITQSDRMSVFNESSVNTVRCVTLNTKNGIKVFPFSFLKCGRRGSFVDNGGAGGILIGINDENGMIDTDGFDEAGRRFACHPDSGVTFKGYQLPDWDQVHSLCKDAASEFSGLKYCSWDVAHTDKGWILVEGNAFGMMVGQQMTEERGIKADLQKYMEDMELLTCF